MKELYLQHLFKKTLTSLSPAKSTNRFQISRILTAYQEVLSIFEGFYLLGTEKII